MSETEETIRNRYKLVMFKENDLYLRGGISLEECQKRLKNLENAMQEEILRFRAIEKVHKRKKRVE